MSSKQSLSKMYLTHTSVPRIEPFRLKRKLKLKPKKRTFGGEKKKKNKGGECGGSLRLPKPFSCFCIEQRTFHARVERRPFARAHTIGDLVRSVKRTCQPKPQGLSPGVTLFHARSFIFVSLSSALLSFVSSLLPQSLSHQSKAKQNKKLRFRTN